MSTYCKVPWGNSCKDSQARLAYIASSCCIIEVILYIIHPFYRFVGEDMMTDLRYPMKDSTVPVWAVPLYAVLLPIAIFVLFYLRRADVYDLHHSILGLLFAVLITGVLTDAIKNAVGRPRPDFFWRCFPDGKYVYDRWGNVICHGKDSDIKEGHKSFPSGHTSWSFAGLGFLSLYLSGKIKVFDQRGHVAKLCIVFLPILAACLVGISRVDDYWHHWQDVFAGGVLGLLVATFCYLQFFPPPYHTEVCFQRFLLDSINSVLLETHTTLIYYYEELIAKLKSYQLCGIPLHKLSLMPVLFG